MKRINELTKHLRTAVGSDIETTPTLCLFNWCCSVTSFSLDPFSNCASNSGVALSVLRKESSLRVLALVAACIRNSSLEFRLELLIFVSRDVLFLGDRRMSLIVLVAELSRLIFLNSFFKSVDPSMQLGNRRWFATISLRDGSMWTGVDEARMWLAVSGWRKPLFLRICVCWRVTSSDEPCVGLEVEILYG